MRQLHRFLRRFMRDAVGRTLVEGHGDVDAEALLDVDGALGGEEMCGAVDVRTKLDAFLAQLANRREREDLIAAGVTQDCAIPRHELVDAAELLDQLHARSQHQVIGVVEDDPRSDER